MRSTLISVAALVGAGLATPAAGFANDPVQTYAVSGCSVGGRIAPLEGWASSSIPSTARVAVDECAATGRMGFDLTPWVGGIGQWTFTAPPGTTVELIRFYDLLGSGDSSNQLSISTDARVSVAPIWVSNLEVVPNPFTYSAGSTRSFMIEFRCPDTCLAVSPSSVRATRLEAVLRDVSAPTVVFDASTETLRFADRGGGVESVDIEVDGVSRHLQLGGGSCQRPFVHVVPCPTSGAVALTDLQLEPGQHSVFAKLTDLVGNHAYSGPYVVDIKRPAAVPGTTHEPDTAGAPANPAAVLTLDGEQRSRIGYRPITMTGIVRDKEGFPIADAPVVPSTRTGAGAWQVLPGVRTKADGKFSVTVPKGPSREVRLSSGDATQTVKVIVVAPIRLSIDRAVTRNGKSIAFSGRVPEAGSGRVRVTLQALARGKWMPFKTVWLKNGRFGAHYRFTGTFATTRYRFRAAIGEQPDFPFAAGHSSTASVLVRAKRGAR